MGKTTLFIASPGRGNNREALFNELLSLYPGNDYSHVLYLSPDNFLLSEARDLFFSFRRDKGEGPAYIPFRSMTVRQFAADLYGESGGKTPVSGHIRTLILCELLRGNGTGYAAILSDLYRKSRNYLPGMDFPGIKEKIGKLIDEEKARERALQALGTLEKYEDELKLKELADPEDILMDCIPFIKEAPGFETLVIDGFLDPSPLEFEVIKTLIEKAGRVHVIVEENTEMLKQLRSYQKDIVIKKLEPGIRRKTASYYSYPSIEDEVEGIAKGIKKLIIEGTRPREIAVCFPLLAKYLPMVQRIFRKYGVPADIGEYNLSTTRPFVLIEEMITCMEEDYPRSDFLSLLTSPYLNAVPHIVKERAVAYSYRAGIVKGKESWRSIRETLLNAHRGRIMDTEKQELAEFQKELGSIINIIEELKLEKDLSSFIDIFESALTKLGFFDSLGDNSEISEKITRQFSELRNFAGLYAKGSHSSSPGFYLRYMLKDLKGSLRNREGVRLLPFELAAGADTKVLFFGGILEGDFPSRPGIDPILPEKVKKALGMPHLEYYLKRQKQYFNRLLNVSLHDPYFSCPSADGDKVFLPSPFLEWGESIKPLNLDIFSEEEVLEREGSISKETLNPIYWSGELFRTKSDNSALQKRMAMIARGSISVTDIDFYRKCPLRFYIEKVLGLEKEVPPKFEVESRLWGSLAHKTMEYLFREGDVEIEMLEEKILEGLEKGLEHFPIGGFWSIVAKEIFLKIMPRMKEQENDIRIEGFSPCMVEKSIKAEIGGLKLRGKIDRVDKKVQSPKSKVQKNKEDESVILLDYKTGGIDNDSLQLPLYAFMWQETSSEKVEKVGYYSLKEGRVKWYPGKKTGMEEFISNAVSSAQELAGEIRKGKFPSEPFKLTECRYCDHSPLCGAAK